MLGTFAFAYVLYALDLLHWLHNAHGGNMMMATLLGGMLFTFGFTTAFGIGILVEIAPNTDPMMGALIGGLGALIADMAIFEAMQIEFFSDEINRLKSTRAILWIKSVLHHERFPARLRKILLIGFAGIIIASPLPDEFGVTLVSSMTSISTKAFMFISWVCNTIGIFIILIGARIIA